MSWPFRRLPVRAKYRPRDPSNRDKKNDPPTSGKNPIAVSGMAKTVFSVAIRYCPWTDIPAPPPTTEAREKEEMTVVYWWCRREGIWWAFCKCRSDDLTSTPFEKIHFAAPSKVVHRVGPQHLHQHKMTWPLSWNCRTLKWPLNNSCFLATSTSSGSHGLHYLYEYTQSGEHGFYHFHV